MTADRDQLAVLLDGVSDAAFTLDGEGRLTYLNRAAVERVGRPASALVGRRAAEVLPPAEGSAVAEAHERASATGEPARAGGVASRGGRFEVRAHPVDGLVCCVARDVGPAPTGRACLPAPAEAASAAPADGGAPLPGRGELVLVVDDETSVRTLTRRTLESAGYRVVTARDGAEAVAVYARDRDEIALVVTDVMMPVMDGTATVNALRRIDPDVRVIAVSGLTTHLRGLTTPAPFLAKPFTTESLLRAVDAALARPVAPGGD